MEWSSDLTPVGSHVVKLKAYVMDVPAEFKTINFKLTVKVIAIEAVSSTPTTIKIKQGESLPVSASDYFVGTYPEITDISVGLDE